jgi:large subunit ribosomal protein L19
MDAIKFVQEQMSAKREFPEFAPGDNIVVNYKIIEGDKERVQAFRGDVIQISGHTGNRTFTVRKMSNGVGVERIFPYAAPNIVDIQLLKRGKVRRARLFYLRDLVGKKARIKELKSLGGKTK